jgi:hypothetical protein
MLTLFMLFYIVFIKYNVAIQYKYMNSDEYREPPQMCKRGAILIENSLNV